MFNFIFTHGEVFTVIGLECILLVPFFYLLIIRKVNIFSPIVLFIAVYFVYFGFPSLFYLFYKPNFVPSIYYYLTIAAIYEIGGAIFFYIGYILVQKTSIVQKIHAPSPSLALPSKKFLLGISIVLGAISFISLIYYMHLVGGIGFYLKHLGETNELALGKVYFIWGIECIKIAAIMVFAFALYKKARNHIHIILSGMFVLLALGVVGLVGARQIVVVGVIEALVLIHFLYKKIPLAIICALTLLIIAFVLVYGEYRIHTFVKHKSFISQLEKTYSNFNLTAYRLTNNYFDSVQTFAMVLYHTQAPNSAKHLNFEDGRTYLSLLVQPIPSKFRPKIETSNEAKFFCSGGRGAYCRVISSLGELYLNFHGIGIAIGMFLLGMLSSIVWILMKKVDKSRSIYPWYVLFYSIFVTGIFVGIRGYFIGAMTSVLMDFAPMAFLFLCAYFMYRGDEKAEEHRD